jgi:hypothetical protein
MSFTPTGSSFTVTNVGAQPDSQTHEDLTRVANLPRRIIQTRKIGAVGSTGNDHLYATIYDSKLNADGKSVLCTIKIEASLPRDTAWVLTDSSEAIECAAGFLTDVKTSLWPAGQLIRT